jgi:hypothetical protein
MAGETAFAIIMCGPHVHGGVTSVYVAK